MIKVLSISLDMLQVIIWISALYVIGILSLPVAEKLKACYLSKIIGLMILTCMTWAFSSLIDFRTAVFYSFLLYLSLFFPLCIIFRRSFSRNCISDFHKAEALFILFFSLYTCYVMFNPDIFGGEKMTEIAILNGVLKSRGMPPLDVNLAGFRLNCYYYMGYITVGILSVLSASKPTVAFNLGVATFFSLAASVLICFSIIERKKFLPFLFFAGNLSSFLILIGSSMGFVDYSRAFDFWTVTRIIPGTINEFPFATLTFRDLHPHMMSIPFQILFLITLYTWFKEGRRMHVAFLFALLGFMFTLNSWDFITYSFLLILALIVKRDFRSLFYIPLALLLVLPFYSSLESYALKGIGITGFDLRTSLHDFIITQPLILIPFALTFVINRRISIISILASLPVAFLLNLQVLLITAPILAVFIKRILREREFDDLTVFYAALVLLLVEIFYLDDPYGGKLERLNTIFKTYIQVWIILSFACSLKILRTYNIPFKIFALVLIAILWIYPIGCISNPSEFRGTLDGMKFTEKYREFEALSFLQKYEGVVLEYPGKNPYETYTYSGRVSAFTGLQSVISRGGHELFWRFFNNSTAEILCERWADVNEIYSTRNLEEMKMLMKKYNVKYIYIGYLERLNYDEKSLKKFRMFDLLYSDGNVEIYAVPNDFYYH